MDDGDEDLLSVKRVAAMVDVSERQIWRMVREHRFPPPAMHGAKYTRWRRGDVRQWTPEWPDKPVYRETFGLGGDDDLLP